MHRRLTALVSAVCIRLAALLGAAPASAAPPGISGPELASTRCRTIDPVVGPQGLRRDQPRPGDVRRSGCAGVPGTARGPLAVPARPLVKHDHRRPQFPGWRFSTATVALTYEGWAAVG